jgi:D-alanyl-D-alanine carboxypeptidase
MRGARIWSAALVAVLVLTSGGPASAQKPPGSVKPGGAPGLTAPSAILVNLSDDGQILFARGARVRRAPASLTKIVTALVVRDEYGLAEIVQASPLVLQTDGSDLGLEPGMSISVRELLYALLMKSANDAGMAIAAHDPGGYEHFVALMNQKARALGAYDSNFRNPHGLDQIGHYSSARDMAIFMSELMRDPLLAKITGTRRHTFVWKGRERTFAHHHKLLMSNHNVIAGKTGFTNAAGHSLITVTRTRAGRLLTIVMGSQDQYGDTLRLIEYGKQVSEQQASGGGSVEGYGRLPAPPSPPHIALPHTPPVTAGDPRDDIRWSVLMMVLAFLTVVSVRSSRRRTPARGSSVASWLATLQTRQDRGR